MICTKCGTTYEPQSMKELSIEEDPLCPFCSDGQIPTGRYAFSIGSQLFYIWITRVNGSRRYTTVRSWSFSDEGWAEIVDPKVKTQLFEVMRGLNLLTASALYTAMTEICGVCGRFTSTDHDACLERKFGYEVRSTGN